MSSCILHNVCTIDDHDTYSDLEEMGHDLMWQAHFKQFKAMMCPSCVRRQARHCVHITAHRTRRTLRLSGDARAMRNTVRDMLWSHVLDQDWDEEHVREIMREAHTRDTPDVPHMQREFGPLGSVSLLVWKAVSGRVLVL